MFAAGEAAEAVEACCVWRRGAIACLWLLERGYVNLHSNAKSKTPRVAATVCDVWVCRARLKDVSRNRVSVLRVHHSDGQVVR